MKITLSQLRQNREKRFEQMRTLRASAGRKEVLLTNNVVTELWLPPQDKTIKFDMRVMQYMATSEEHLFGMELGAFADFLVYQYHDYIGPSNRAFVCPRVYNLPCPVCDKYWSFTKEERYSNDMTINKFKPRQMALFNAIIKDRSGRQQVKVVRMGDYASMRQIQKRVKDEINSIKDDASLSEEDRKELIEVVYGYSDLEFGYFLKIQHGKAAAIDGGIEFPHFTLVDVSNHEEVLQRKKAGKEPDVVEQKYLDQITDLNLLMPAPVEFDTLVEWMGDDAPSYVANKAEKPAASAPVSTATYTPEAEPPQAEPVDDAEWAKAVEQEAKETATPDPEPDAQAPEASKETPKEAPKEAPKTAPRKAPKAKPAETKPVEPADEPPAELEAKDPAPSKGDFDDDFEAFGDFE